MPHSPEAVRPESNPRTIATTSMNFDRYGSMEARYRSRLACSGVMPLNVGRVRHASHMTRTSAPNISPPNPANRTALVTSCVVKTSVLSTESNHRKSV
ncbi:unannotated protein [freshwater metagenome]|uniref:Unannotated protein n=1 Tax=freshwater metagenome TaxID=449393 RepID=A0A6J6TNF5_9ZZZZ